MLERGFPVSFELGMTAIVIAVISGLVLGVIAALRRNGFLDYAAMSLAVLGISIPNFILATLLIQQFAVNLKLFPAATWTSPIHMVLPTAALAVGPMAIIAKADTVKRGRSSDSGLYPHSKSKRAFPVQNYCETRTQKCTHARHYRPGTLVASILTGSFVIEKIFAIPEWENIL